MKFLPYLLVSALIVSTIACNKKKDEATMDPTAPSFSTAVTASSISSTGFTLTWAATDDNTAATDIKFKVVSSTT